MRNTLKFIQQPLYSRYSFLFVIGIITILLCTIINLVNATEFYSHIHTANYLDTKFYIELAIDGDTHINLSPTDTLTIQPRNDTSAYYTSLFNDFRFTLSHLHLKCYHGRKIDRNVYFGPPPEWYGQLISQLDLDLTQSEYENSITPIQLNWLPTMIDRTDIETIDCFGYIEFIPDPDLCCKSEQAFDQHQICQDSCLHLFPKDKWIPVDDPQPPVCCNLYAGAQVTYQFAADENNIHTNLHEAHFSQPAIIDPSTYSIYIVCDDYPRPEHDDDPRCAEGSPEALSPYCTVLRERCSDNFLHIQLSDFTAPGVRLVISAIGHGGLLQEGHAQWTECTVNGMRFPAPLTVEDDTIVISLQYQYQLDNAYVIQCQMMWMSWQPAAAADITLRDHTLFAIDLYTDDILPPHTATLPLQIIKRSTSPRLLSAIGPVSQNLHLDGFAATLQMSFAQTTEARLTDIIFFSYRGLNISNTQFVIERADHSLNWFLMPKEAGQDQSFQIKRVFTGEPDEFFHVSFTFVTDYFRADDNINPDGSKKDSNDKDKRQGNDEHDDGGDDDEKDQQELLSNTQISWIYHRCLLSSQLIADFDILPPQDDIDRCLEFRFCIDLETFKPAADPHILMFAPILETIDDFYALAPNIYAFGHDRDQKRLPPNEQNNNILKNDLIYHNMVNNDNNNDYKNNNNTNTNNDNNTNHNNNIPHITNGSVIINNDNLDHSIIPIKSHPSILITTTPPMETQTLNVDHNFDDDVRHIQSRQPVVITTSTGSYTATTTTSPNNNTIVDKLDKQQKLMGTTNINTLFQSQSPQSPQTPQGYALMHATKSKTTIFPPPSKRDKFPSTSTHLPSSPFFPNNQLSSTNDIDFNVQQDNIVSSPCRNIDELPPSRKDVPIVAPSFSFEMNHIAGSFTFLHIWIDGLYLKLHHNENAQFGNPCQIRSLDDPTEPYFEPSTRFQPPDYDSTADFGTVTSLYLSGINLQQGKSYNVTCPGRFLLVNLECLYGRDQDGNQPPAITVPHYMGYITLIAVDAKGGYYNSGTIVRAMQPIPIPHKSKFTLPYIILVSVVGGLILIALITLLIMEIKFRRQHDLSFVRQSCSFLCTTPCLVLLSYCCCCCQCAHQYRLRQKYSSDPDFNWDGINTTNNNNGSFNLGNSQYQCHQSETHSTIGNNSTENDVDTLTSTQSVISNTNNDDDNNHIHSARKISVGLFPPSMSTPHLLIRHDNSQTRRAHNIDKDITRHGDDGDADQEYLPPLQPELHTSE